MRSWSADSDAPPPATWGLYARPGRWHEWAPHLRGAWHLADADGEVRAGARGAVRLLGAVPVPARVTEVVPGASWTWQVGLVTMRHRVTPRVGGGSTVTLDLTAPGPLEALVARAYGPLVAPLLRRLAERAHAPGAAA